MLVPRHRLEAVHPNCRGANEVSSPTFGLKPETWLALLLRSVRRVWISFAGNCLLRFRRLGVTVLLIGSASSKDHRRASEQNQTHVFHGHTNTKEIKPYKRYGVEICAIEMGVP